MSERLPRKIVTERLVLRPFEWSDIEGYLATMSDAACRRYVLNGARISPVRAWLRLAAIRWLAAVRGHRYWAISPTAAPGFAGYVAVHGLRGRECWLSFALHPQRRRMALAREAVRAVCNEIASRAPSMQIGVRVHPDNEASIRLMERLGFERDVECEGRVIYRVRA